MPHARDLNPQQEELVKLPHHGTGQGILQVLPLALPVPRHTLILRGEVLRIQALAVAYQEVVLFLLIFYTEMI